MDNLLFTIEIKGISEQISKLGSLKEELMQIRKSQSELNKEYQAGNITQKAYHENSGILEAKTQALRNEQRQLKQDVNSVVTSYKAAEGSMTAMNRELGQMREQYRNLSKVERENVEIGGKLLTKIQATDSELKKLDATIGNHQRNVGNYKSHWEGLGQSMLSNLPMFNQISSALSIVTASANALAQSTSVASDASRVLNMDMKALNGAVLSSTGTTGGLSAGMLALGGAIGVAALAFGGFLKLTADGVGLAMAEEKELGRLKYALDGNMEAYNRMVALRERLRDTTSFSEEEITNAINYGLSMGRSEEQLQKLITTSMGLSKVTGDDLQSSMARLQATYEGVTRGLNRYASGIKDLTPEQLKAGAAIDLIGEKLNKFATTGLSSTAGMLAQSTKYFNEFKEALGFAVMPVVNAFARVVNSVTMSLKDWVSVPVSETLQKERDDVQRLIGSITSLNEGSDLRKRLLDELANKYPSLLENINKETVSNRDLAAMVGKVNESYEKKIRLAVYGEEMTAIQKKGEEIFKQQQQNIAEIDKLYKQHITNAKEDATVQEKINALRQVRVTVEEVFDAETGAMRSREVVGLREIEDIAIRYERLQKQQIVNKGEYNNILNKETQYKQQVTKEEKESLDKSISELQTQKDITEEGRRRLTVLLDQRRAILVASGQDKISRGLQPDESEKKAIADQKAIDDAKNKAQEGQNKLTEITQKGLQSRAEAISRNNDYIIKLAQDAVDAEIMAIADGWTRETQIESSRFLNKTSAIRQEADARTQAIDEELSKIEAKGQKATAIELQQAETLRGQKVAIQQGTNKAIEAEFEKHKLAMQKIDDQYSTTKQDDAIQQKYSESIAKAEEEADMKLAILDQYLATESGMTLDEQDAIAKEKIKIELDLAKKKYDLLLQEIAQRKELGVITQEDYDKQLALIAKLYAEIKKLGSAAPEKKESASLNTMITDQIIKVGVQLTGLDQESEKLKAWAGAVKQQVGEMLGALQNLWLETQQNKIEAELKAEEKKLDKQYKAENKALDTARKKGYITEEQYQAKKEKLDEEMEAKKTELQRQAFEKNKRLQITNIWINAAVGVIKSIAEYGFILGGILGALILITAGIQANTVSKQQFTGAKGGYIEGRSHAEGGEKWYSQNKTVELEGDEAVINKQSLRDDRTYTVTGTPKQIASAVNTLDGNGVQFAPGAQIKRTEVKKEASIEDIRTRYMASETEKKFLYGGVISGDYRPSGVTGFRKYETGGYVPAPIPQQYQRVEVSQFSTTRISDNLSASNDRLAERIASSMSAQKVYVLEQDITETQDKVKKIKVESQW